MEPRTYYRVALSFMVLLLVAGTVESRAWWHLAAFFTFGVAVWRAELPTWDELWDRGDNK